MHTYTHTNSVFRINYTGVTSRRAECRIHTGGILQDARTYSYVNSRFSRLLDILWGGERGFGVCGKEGVSCGGVVVLTQKSTKGTRTIYVHCVPLCASCIGLVVGWCMYGNVGGGLPAGGGGGV